VRVWYYYITFRYNEKSPHISKKVVILKNMMIMPMRCDFTSLECHVLRYRY